MISTRIVSIALCAFSLAVYTGCSGKSNTDNTMENRSDTTTVGSAVNNAGQEIKSETIEKVVETALIAKPGFENVTVESQPDGVIILSGSVVSENQKAQAQVIAENTSGVKRVMNNLTIRQ